MCLGCSIDPGLALVGTWLRQCSLPMGQRLAGTSGTVQRRHLWQLTCIPTHVCQLLVKTARHSLSIFQVAL